MLLRTLQSVLERSPPELLREVLLIDDSSDDPGLAAAVRGHIESRRLQHTVSHGSRPRGGGRMAEDSARALRRAGGCAKMLRLWKSAY